MLNSTDLFTNNTNTVHKSNKLISQNTALYAEPYLSFGMYAASERRTGYIAVACVALYRKCFVIQIEILQVSEIYNEINDKYMNE